MSAPKGHSAKATANAIQAITNPGQPKSLQMECIDPFDGVWVECRCVIKDCDCEPLEGAWHGFCHTHFWMLPRVLKRNLWSRIHGSKDDAIGWIGRQDS